MQFSDSAVAELIERLTFLLRDDVHELTEAQVLHNDAATFLHLIQSGAAVSSADAIQQYNKVEASLAHLESILGSNRNPPPVEEEPRKGVEGLGLAVADEEIEGLDEA